MTEKVYLEQTKLLQHIDWYMSMKEKNYGNPTITFDEVIMLITEVPAADVVEVIHGEWIDVPYPNNPNWEPRKRCFICGRFVRRKTENYCPDCGAKMDGKGNNNE